MKPKDMTLGELACEYIAAYTVGRSSPRDHGLFIEMMDLRTELIARLDLLEMSIPEKLEWGIPKEMEEALVKKKDYAEEVNKKS